MISFFLLLKVEMKLDQHIRGLNPMLTSPNQQAEQLKSKPQFLHNQWHTSIQLAGKGKLPGASPGGG